MPIINIPSAEQLDDFALILYFDAWERLSVIIADFNMTFTGGKSKWKDEWSDYLIKSQRDFETITSMAAQSAEIALKARLCAVSPYLLLISQGRSLKTSPETIDFTDLRTIDAVDLPGAVNTFSDHPLSDSFIKCFHDIRRLRNKSIHLGQSASHISISFIVDSMVTVFSALWPLKKFHAEWVRTLSSGRFSFFTDGSYQTPHAQVFDTIDSVYELLSKSQFKRLIGHEKSKRRYHCFNCLEAGRIKWEDWVGHDCARTAFLNADGSGLDCMMCEGVFPVVRDKCGIKNCKGDVLSLEPDDYYHSVCHTCCGEVSPTP